MAKKRSKKAGTKTSKDLTPKPGKPGRIALPTYLRRGNTGDVANTAVNRINEDLTQLRLGADNREIVRNLMKTHPDVSHATDTTVRFIITDSYTVLCRNMLDATIDVEATKYVQALVARMDRLSPNYQTFNPQNSFASLSETLLSQMLANGAAMAELVLDKARMPSHIAAISTNTLKYEQKGDRAIPYITVQGEKIYLDSPTVRIAVLNQDPDNAYSDSYYEAALQAIIASEEYRNDIRKAFRKASLPRVRAQIDTEKFLSQLPSDVHHDPTKLTEAMNSLIADIETKLNNLNPEDVVVNFDVLEVDHLSQGNTSTHDSVATHAKVIDGLVSSGLKTLPSILGRGESQTIASTEAVLLLKKVENLQNRLNELLSGNLTLAARLAGYDVFAEFKYNKPSLRSENEDESFLTMRQSRVLEQLSLGMISDEEASIKLTKDLPSGNFTPLSGTGFHNAKEPVENPYSNTSVSGKGSTLTQVQKDTKSDEKKPKTNRTTR